MSAVVVVVDVVVVVVFGNGSPRSFVCRAEVQDYLPKAKLSKIDPKSIAIHYSSAAAGIVALGVACKLCRPSRANGVETRAGFCVSTRNLGKVLPAFAGSVVAVIHGVCSFSPGKPQIPASRMCR